jgi:ribokinase
MGGKVGLDTLGEEYSAQLISEGVEISFLKRSRKATGVACINVEASTGANTIIIVPGANQDISVEDVNEMRGVIEGSRVLVCQNEIPRAATLRGLEIASRSESVISIFNPAPATTDLKELISLSDIVCPNVSF